MEPDRQRPSPVKQVHLGELSSTYAFLIPLYQRPFSWGYEEIATLLNDLYRAQRKNDTEYFLGTLVVAQAGKKKDGKDVLEVIDGQQRLTTLFLIQHVLSGLCSTNEVQMKDLVLEYRIRERAKEFLEELQEKVQETIQKKDLNEFLSWIADLSERKEAAEASALVQAVLAIHRWASEHPDACEKVYRFLNSDRGIVFVLSFVPKSIDVARFFEVMNSRGKQLDPPSVLKARFLNLLPEQGREFYAALWDACSMMDIPIWNTLLKAGEKGEQEKEREEESLLTLLTLPWRRINDIQEIEEELSILQKGADHREGGKISLIELMEKIQKEPSGEEVGKKRDAETTHQAPVRFSTFLLHAMWLFRHGVQKEELKEDEISLADSELLQTFQGGSSDGLWFAGSENQADIARKFLLFLLQLRIILDLFVIRVPKRGIQSREGAVLERVQERNRQSDNIKHLENLQHLFYLTAPDYTEQAWLLPTLNFLYGKLQEGRAFQNLDSESLKKVNKEVIEKVIEEVINQDLLPFLQRMNHAMATERLEERENRDFMGNVFWKFLNDPQHSSTPDRADQDHAQKLREALRGNGTRTEHYWFYLTDYLLWRKWKTRKQDKGNPWTEEEKESDEQGRKREKNALKQMFEQDEQKQELENMISDFRFRNLDSVEHIWPKSGKEAWEKDKEKYRCNGEGCGLDDFGNLALISFHMNMTLGAQSFDDKRRDLIKQLKRGTLESLKMLLVYKRYDEWNPQNAKEHHEEMIQLLQAYLENPESVTQAT